MRREGITRRADRENRAQREKTVYGLLFAGVNQS